MCVYENVLHSLTDYVSTSINAQPTVSGDQINGQFAVRTSLHCDKHTSALKCDKNINQSDNVIISLTRAHPKRTNFTR